MCVCLLYEFLLLFYYISIIYTFLMITATEINNSRKKLKIIFGTHGVTQFSRTIFSLMLCNYLTFQIYNIYKM